jgi:ABC-2 type transport system permease protein
VGNFFNALVRNYLTNIVARDIRDGSLSMSLVRPIHYFRFVIAREVGRISMATTFSALTTALVIVFFSSRFLWNTDMVYLFLILGMLVLAFCMEILLSFLVGLFAFWVDEVDGIYSSVNRLRNFFSGGYFPLNLLPTLFVQVSFCLPFAYSFFVPAQLYLKKMSLFQGAQGLVVQIVWIVLLYGIVQFVWKRGLKRYEGVGI